MKKLSYVVQKRIHITANSLYLEVGDTIMYDPTLVAANFTVYRNGKILKTVTYSQVGVTALIDGKFFGPGEGASAAEAPITKPTIIQKAEIIAETIKQEAVQVVDTIEKTIHDTALKIHLPMEPLSQEATKIETEITDLKEQAAKVEAEVTEAVKTEEKVVETKIAEAKVVETKAAEVIEEGAKIIQEVTPDVQKMEATITEADAATPKTRKGRNAGSTGPTGAAGDTGVANDPK